MNKSIVSIVFLLLCILFACQKKGESSSGNGPSRIDTTVKTDTTKPPPVDTTKRTDTVGTGTGNNNGYVVKTIGISRIRVVLDDNDNIDLAELIGGGNRIILKKGNDYQMEFSNPKGYEPSVVTYADSYPSANYPVVNAPINNTQPLDTSMIAIKLRGFDKAKTGYNQLNLVLCKETVVRTDPWNMYNLMMLRMNKKGNSYANSFYKKFFTGPISIHAMEIPPTASPYIIRDAIVVESLIVTDPNDNPTRFSAGNGYTNVKFNLATGGALNIGGPVKMELVNAGKGTLKVLDSYSGLISNIKTAAWGYADIPLPEDTVGKVFVRITGFDASLTGFNQLRLILTDDDNSGGGYLGYYQYATPLKPVTVPLIEKAYNAINNFTCVLVKTD